MNPDPEPVAEPVLGYRHWHINEGHLTAVASFEGPPGKMRRTRWNPNTRMTAQCSNLHLPAPVREHHDAPEPGCQCGIYALKSPPLLRPDWMYPSPQHHHYYGTSWGIAYGTILMWGRIIEHEHGYRAQHASIHTLIGGTDRLEALADAYNVPTTEPWN